VNSNGVFYFGFKFQRLKILDTITNLTKESSIQVLLKDNKAIKHNSTFYFLFILTTCFGQLTIIRPSLQNLESVRCSENKRDVIWDPIRPINVLKCVKIL
jgi:hypothetical protein